MLLFRREALIAKEVRWLGHIVMVRPLSFSVLTLLSIAIAALIAGVLFFGTYTKRTAVHGQLLPATGQIRVVSQQPGVVLEKLVQEGQLVEKGAVLYKISSEQYGEDAGAVLASISQNLTQRRESLLGEQEKSRQLHAAERHTLSRKIASLREELAVQAEQLKSQRAYWRWLTMPSSDTRGCWIRAISRKTSSSSGNRNNWAKCRCFSACGASAPPWSNSW